jgi:hypothetical protein
MKQVYFFISLLLPVVAVKAQGTMTITSGATLKTSGNIFVVVNDCHLTNNGTIQQASGDGSFKFTGSADVNISGSSMATFDKLNIAKTSSKVALLQNVNVVGQVNFTSGLLDLTNSVLDFGTTGMVTGETETSRIFTFGNGYAQIINVLNAPVAANPGNLGAVITSTKNLGSITIKRGHKAQTNVSGTTPSILRYYDISPDNDKSLKATLRFYYFDAELNGLNENTLQLWKQSKNSWLNIGYSSRNTTLDYVEETGINALSRWTLSSPPVPGSTNLYTSPPSENDLKERFLLWPNPVNDFVTVSIIVSQPADIRLMLYDIKGASIEVQQSKLAVGNNQLRVNMSHLTQGIYTLQCKWGNNSRVTKLVKL